MGNGRLGAMVYGGVAQEQLALNEDTLWSDRPRDHTNPEALPHLAQVRESGIQMLVTHGVPNSRPKWAPILRQAIHSARSRTGGLPRRSWKA